MAKLNLYKHNQESYTKVKDAYERGERVVGVIHATGTGKTYLALQLALDNPGTKITYVVPSKSIIEHIKTVIEKEGLSLEKDFPNLELTTYQNLSRKSDEELENRECDLLILDEFHHLTAPVWGPKINHFIDTHPDMKIFGMSAYTTSYRGTIYERDIANPNGEELFSNKIVSRCNS